MPDTISAHLAQARERLNRTQGDANVAHLREAVEHLIQAVEAMGEQEEPSPSWMFMPLGN